jgi:hypothetical protein
MRTLRLEELEPRELLNGTGFHDGPPVGHPSRHEPVNVRVTGCPAPIACGSAGPSCMAAAIPASAANPADGTSPPASAAATNTIPVLGSDGTIGRVGDGLDAVGAGTTPSQAEPGSDTAAAAAIVEAALVALVRPAAPQPQLSTPASHPDDQSLDFSRIPAVAPRRDAGAVGLVLPARAGRETPDDGTVSQPLPHVDAGLRAAMSAELSTVELGIRRLLERLDGAVAPLVGPGGAAKFYGWAVAAAAVAVIAGEISRRQLRPAGMDPDEVRQHADETTDDSWKG